MFSATQHGSCPQSLWDSFHKRIFWKVTRATTRRYLWRIPSCVENYVTMPVKKVSWLHNWIGCISVGSGPGLQITNVILKTLPKTSNLLSMNCLSFQFLSKHSLNKHHKVAHSDNAKRYPCVTCGQTFAKKSWWATILAVSFLSKLNSALGP